MSWTDCAAIGVSFGPKHRIYFSNHRNRPGAHGKRFVTHHNFPPKRKCASNHACAFSVRSLYVLSHSRPAAPVLVLVPKVKPKRSKCHWEMEFSATTGTTHFFVHFKTKLNPLPRDTARTQWVPLCQKMVKSYPNTLKFNLWCVKWTARPGGRTAKGWEGSKHNCFRTNYETREIRTSTRLKDRHASKCNNSDIPSMIMRRG